MNGGQIIAQILHQHGIQHLFTLCGGHISPIYIEAERIGIRVWDVRHEATAVFAADAVARLSGIPGIVAVTAGPGVTNALTAIKNAQLAQSPLVLLGGATATLLRNRGALQDIDQLALLRSTVKFQARAKSIQDLYTLLPKALRIAQEEVPGPVFLECPVDLLYPEAIVREWYLRENKPARNWKQRLEQWYIRRHLRRLFAGVDDRQGHHRRIVKPGIPHHSSADIRIVAKALAQAERPILLLSSGAMQLPHLAPELAAAVIQLGIPFYLSGMARGLAGTDDHCQYFHRRKQALREADLILLAGVPCDFRLGYGRGLNHSAQKIAINRSWEELRKNLRPNRAIHTDPGTFIVELSEAVPGLPGWSDWKSTLRERDWAREAEIDRLAEQPVDHINPLSLFRTLETLLPQNSVLIADGGDFAASAAYTLRPRGPLKWLDPGVFGTLGVGGGFALGAAACHPDDYIWIIYGDGSAAYSLAEFETFAKNGLKVCAIVGNNGSWEQIERDQVELLGADTAVRLPRTDYDQVAIGYGGAGTRVDQPAAFQAAIQSAMEHMNEGKPYLINAIIGSTTFRKGSISM